jgi:hypothetical protein
MIKKYIHRVGKFGDRWEGATYVEVDDKVVDTATVVWPNGRRLSHHSTMIQSWIDLGKWVPYKAKSNVIFLDANV